MIIYSVTIEIDQAIEQEWLEWMQHVHIPDVLRTECFRECGTYKLLDAEPGASTYVLRYSCESLAEYHRYRDNFAPALQKDHAERFGGRFRASRQLLEEAAPAQAP
jgi:hypothetical protein